MKRNVGWCSFLRVKLIVKLQILRFCFLNERKVISGMIMSNMVSFQTTLKSSLKIIGSEDKVYQFSGFTVLQQ